MGYNKRKNMFTVMANACFGDLVIRKAGYEFFIPQAAVNKNGQLKVSVRKLLYVDIPQKEREQIIQKYGIGVKQVEEQTA